MSHSFTPVQIRGFSLIELIIVIVLIGIMAGIAVPSFGRMIEHSRVDRAVDRLVADISQARMTAVRSGAPVGVELHDGGYHIRSMAQNGDEVTRHVRLDNGLMIKLAEPIEISFDSRGLATDGIGQEVTMEGRRGVQQNITINSLGRAHRGN